MVEIKNAILLAAENIHRRELGENQESINNFRGLKPESSRILKSTVSDATKYGRTNNGNNNNPLLHIFSGHDTVIAPVLTALGIYQHSSYCNWPKYASRIAFEVWTPIGKNAKKYPINREAFNLKLSNVHVRVVYNGEDVTQHITACAKKNVKFGRHSKSILCPLDLFVEQIDSNLAPYTSLEDACRLS